MVYRMILLDRFTRESAARQGSTILVRIGRFRAGRSGSVCGQVQAGEVLGRTFGAVN